MWYDATVAAGLLEAKDSRQGQERLRVRTGRQTKASGWLWSWALAIPKSSPDSADAWKYISWATSAQYIKAAGRRQGRLGVDPAGDAALDLCAPAVQAAAKAFANTTLAAMKQADQQSGTTKRPGLPGVQYVGIRSSRMLATVHAALLERDRGSTKDHCAQPVQQCSSAIK